MIYIRLSLAVTGGKVENTDVFTSMLVFHSFIKMINLKGAWLKPENSVRQGKMVFFLINLIFLIKLRCCKVKIRSRNVAQQPFSSTHFGTSILLGSLTLDY